jgi:pimeloyl-ACP methyl ester carboxylesterase
MTEPNSQAILDALLSRCHEIRTPCGDGHLVWRVWGGAAPELPALVLLHGGFGAWNHWVRTIAALEPYYRVIAPDLPGCGDSDDPPRPYDAASLAGPGFTHHRSGQRLGQGAARSVATRSRAAVPGQLAEADGARSGGGR